MAAWLVTYLPKGWEGGLNKRAPMASDHRCVEVYSPDVAHCVEEYHDVRIVAVTLRPADIVRIEAEQMRETGTA